VLVVVNMLLKLLKDYQPRRIAVVFDAPGKTSATSCSPSTRRSAP